MYTVKCDGKWLYNKAIGLDIIDPELDLEVSTAGSFTFSIMPSHPLYSEVYPMLSRIIVYRNDEEIWEGRPTNYTYSFDTNKEFTCEGELAYLNDSVIPFYDYNFNKAALTKATHVPLAILKTVLENHNKQVGNDYRSFYAGRIINATSHLEEFLKMSREVTFNFLDNMRSTYKAEFRIRKEKGKRYLDIVQIGYNDTPYDGFSKQKIEFGYNMLDFSSNFNLSDICTVVIPLGKEESISELVDGIKEYIESLRDAIKSRIRDEQRYTGETADEKVERDLSLLDVTLAMFNDRSEDIPWITSQNKNSARSERSKNRSGAQPYRYNYFDTETDGAWKNIVSINQSLIAALTTLKLTYPWMNLNTPKIKYAQNNIPYFNYQESRRHTLYTLTYGQKPEHVINKDAYAIFGPIYKVVEFDDAKDAATLEKLAKEYLSSVQFDSMDLTVNAFDFNLVDNKIVPFDILDMVFVTSKPHGMINKKFPVRAMKIPLQHPENAEVTLGRADNSFRKTISKSLAQSIRKANNK